MSHVPQTELEQWAVLRTVVEAGTFAKAAEQLNRSQSSVSYASAAGRVPSGKVLG
jgi:DNA-binding transcriptional LysR family regulator